MHTAVCIYRGYLKIEDISGGAREPRNRPWLAEVTEGREFEIEMDRMPKRFKHAGWDRVVQ